MTFSANLPDYIRDDITRNVTFALEEDIRDGDITAQLIDADSRSTATIITREDTVMCGTPWADEVFQQLGDVDVEWHVQDGDRLPAETTLCTLRGNTRKILTGERTALNFLQTLMGTATTARRYADAVAGSQVTILDTRKTLPGLRAGQKYAVLCGGCQNHRIGLYDAFLIKENHVTACGGITALLSGHEHWRQTRRLLWKWKHWQSWRKRLGLSQTRSCWIILVWRCSRTQLEWILSRHWKCQVI